MKRKILSVILTISMTVALLVGCSGEAQEGDTTEGASAGEEDDYVVQIVQGPALCSAPVFIAIINGYIDVYKRQSL